MRIVLALLFASQLSAAGITLTSSSWSGGSVPKKYTCDAGDVSPALAWNLPTGNVKSFTLIVTDLDSPLQMLRGPFVHWILYDLPADKRNLPEAIPQKLQLPDGSKQGANGFDKTGYGGPCPPGSSTHRYVFDIYALDSKLNLAPGATKAQVLAAMKGHIVAQGQLTARYQH